MPEISPSWVQAGELGLAFVVIILCAWLVLYTMRSSAEREKILMKNSADREKQLVEIIQTQTAALQRMADGLEDVVSRLEAIENVIDIKPSRKRKTAA